MRHSARYCIGGWPTISVNRSAKTERDRPTSSRQPLDRPALVRARRAAPPAPGRRPDRAARRATRLRGRQRLEVPADRLDEHQLRQAREHVLAARPRAAPDSRTAMFSSVAQPSGWPPRPAAEGGSRAAAPPAAGCTAARRSPGSRRRCARARARRRRARRRAAAASAARANIDMSGAARMPGALDSTCAITLREHDEVALAAGASAAGRRRCPSTRRARSGGTR